MRFLKITPLIIAFSAMSICADMIDDFEDGNNQNETGYFWRYLINDCDSGVFINNVVSGPDGRMYMMPTAGMGYDEGFTAELSWKFDSKNGDDCINRFVSLITMFCSDYVKGMQWPNATAISFYAKATSTLTVRVQILTIGHSGGGTFFKDIVVNSQWNRYVVKFSELEKADQAYDGEFLNTAIYDMQFDVMEEFVGTPKSGSLYIDDIEINDTIISEENNWFVYDPGLFATIRGTILADFEREIIDAIHRPDLSKFKTMWYVFDDSKIAGTKNSIFTSGIMTNNDDSTGLLHIDAGNSDGYDNSQGLKVAYKLGSSIRINDTVVKPYVGIGCMLSNSDRYITGIDTFLSTADISDGLGMYFDFKVESNNPKLKFFEVAFFDTDSLPDGISFSVQLPVTNGVWRSASFSFDDISLSEIPEKFDALSAAQRSLDLKKIDKLEMRFQNVKGTEATVYLDNFRFFGNVIPPDIYNTMVVPRIRDNRTLVTTKMVENGLIVRLRSPYNGIQAGTIELLKIDGMVMAREKVHTSAASSLLIKTDNLANGVYVLRVNTRNGNDKIYSFIDKVTVFR
jgi:hypothetical protein